MPSAKDGMMSLKYIEQISIGREVHDGAGVKLRRIITSDWHQRLDPWLMLDEFGSDQAQDYIAGFPSHPHRGFETITYMLAGRMQHEDNRGHRGVVEAGGVQWMRAGKGIIHSEMPAQEAGLMRGFQFWLNLAADDKYSDPDWEDIPKERISVYHDDDGDVKVIAGHYAGLHGVIQCQRTQPCILDVTTRSSVARSFTISAEHHSFIYVYEGSIQIGHRALTQGQMAVLSLTGTEVVVVAEAGSAFLLVSAQPLREPIAAHGPFVMNTQAELQQAFIDYRAGHF